MNGWDFLSRMVQTFARAGRPAFALLVLLAGIAVVAVIAIKWPVGLIGLATFLRLPRR